MVSENYTNISVAFRENRAGKTPFEITLKVRGVFTTVSLWREDIARYCKVQGTLELVPRVRALVNNFLAQAGITHKVP